MYQRVDDRPPPQPQAQTAEPVAAARRALDVAYLLSVLWRRKRWVVGTAALCVVAALLVGQFGPKRFVSAAQILIDPNELRVLDNSLRAQNQFSESLIAQIESQVRVLMSDNVARRVIHQLKLDVDPEFAGEPGGTFLSRTLDALRGRSGEPDPVLDALRVFKQRISSKRAERTYVVEVSVWTNNPVKSARIANALVEAFMDEQLSARTEAASRTSAALSSRLSELKERVIAAEQRVDAYKKANNIVAASGSLVNENQLTELSTQLGTARVRTEEAKARYEQIRQFQTGRADPGAISEATQSVTVAALRAQLSEISRREGELTSTLGPRHPVVAEIQSQARSVRRMVTEELGRIAEAARNDYERAKANEDALSRNLDGLKRGLETTNEAFVRLRELERDVQASRSVYEAFLVRTRELSEQGRLDTTNMRVITPAEPPQNRSFPPRTLVLMAAALVLGLGLGAGLALLRDWLPAQIAAWKAAYVPAEAVTAPVTEPVVTLAPAPPVPSEPVLPEPAPPEPATAAAAVAPPQPPDPPLPVTPSASVAAPPVPEPPKPDPAHESIMRLARAVAGDRR